MQKKPELSIVILSYNTKDLLKSCLDSLEKVRKETDFELVIVDNASDDGSKEYITSLKKPGGGLTYIINKANLGFAAGNNVARNSVTGKFILFLNTDTIVHDGTLKESVKYMDQHKNVGAMTCKMLLKNGSFDKDTRRSFVTPWIGFTHLFLKLDRLFPKSKLFGRYWYGYIPDTKEHEVDVIEGAYFFTRKDILDKVGWFDESYFLDGENIDLCWRIKRLGFKVMYYPEISITHFKGATKGKMESETKRNVSPEDRLKFRMAGVDSMERFYRKWLWSRYPFFVNILVIVGIKIIKVARFIRTLLLG